MFIECVCFIRAPNGIITLSNSTSQLLITFLLRSRLAIVNTQTHAHTHTRTHARTHARTHTHTHTHTCFKMHTQIPHRYKQCICVCVCVGSCHGLVCAYFSSLIARFQRAESINTLQGVKEMDGWVCSV